MSKATNDRQPEPPPSTPADCSELRFERARIYDKRFKWGDDYAADAWIDLKLETLIECVVGHNPNTKPSGGAKTIDP